MSKKIFDINSFMKRKNWVQRELAEKVGCHIGLIGVWASRNQTPSFAKCVKLLELGMTVEEMFGTELYQKLQFTEKNEKQKENVEESENLDLLQEFRAFKKQIEHMQTEISDLKRDKLTLEQRQISATSGTRRKVVA